MVVGAGVAGLNALYAATDYLPKGARVLLIDQKQGPGGMWNTAYDFVRLHQPHPMFTVGDVKWDWAKPRDYLAKRDEVQTHLASALGPVSNAVELEAAFQQTVVEAEEVQTDCGYQAKVVFRPNGADSPTRTVLAPLAIHAQGLNYTEAAPLPLASSNVVSIIPQNLRQTLNAHPSARLVVVGGGKTGHGHDSGSTRSGPQSQDQPDKWEWHEFPQPHEIHPNRVEALDQRGIGITPFSRSGLKFRR